MFYYGNLAILTYGIKINGGTTPPPPSFFRITDIEERRITDNLNNRIVD